LWRDCSIHQLQDTGSWYENKLIRSPDIIKIADRYFWMWINILSHIPPIHILYHPIFKTLMYLRFHLQDKHNLMYTLYRFSSTFLYPEHVCSIFYSILVRVSHQVASSYTFNLGSRMWLIWKRHLRNIVASCKQ